MEPERDEGENLYAAPKARIRPRRRDDGTPRSEARFAPMAMPVLAVVALSTLTCGIYSWYWLLTRRKFVDSLDSTQKVGSGLVLAALATNLVSSGLNFASKDFAPLFAVLAIGSTVLWYVVVFRIVAILRTHFARNGIRREISGVAAFFFTTLYVQYVFNRAAEIEAHMDATEERRKRKKKKKRREPVEATVSDDDAMEPTPEP